MRERRVEKRKRGGEGERGEERERRGERRERRGERREKREERRERREKERREKREKDRREERRERRERGKILMLDKLFFFLSSPLPLSSSPLFLFSPFTYPHEVYVTLLQLFSGYYASSALYFIIMCLLLNTLFKP
jgi:hypothetical protein